MSMVKSNSSRAAKRAVRAIKRALNDKRGRGPELAHGDGMIVRLCALERVRRYYGTATELAQLVDVTPDQAWRWCRGGVPSMRHARLIMELLA